MLTNKNHSGNFFREENREDLSLVWEDQIKQHRSKTTWRKQKRLIKSTVLKTEKDTLKYPYSLARENT